MRNLISKTYEKFDDGVMFFVNKGVKVWNYTTGRTKAELANELLTTVPIFHTVGRYVENPIISIASLPVFLLFSHVFQKNNLKQEKLEERASEKGVKNLDAEYLNYGNKFLGPIWMGQGIIDLSIISGDYKYDNYLAAGTFFAGGASFYVMRAECLPPRKNVLSRAKDKFFDFLEEKSKKPVFEPIRE